MIDSFLKIKTSIPPLAPNVVPRIQLQKYIEEDLVVNEGFTHQLTLISAPAGFGKTTFVRSWLKGEEDQTSWYSLDERDNERERFWIYLVSALKTFHSRVGRGTIEMLRSWTFGGESWQEREVLLAPLLNDLFALDKSCYLVLDDYHLIFNSQIHEDMIFFLENLPPTLHLIVTTRSEPPWPLSRWRGRGKMKELRQRDLTFSREEANHLLTEVKDLQLEEMHLHTLYEKTQGWITGLHLAAFSLSKALDVDEFIESFAGSHRHVFHYLSEEVFKRQEESIRVFLQRVSILRRLCGSLCDAITQRRDSSSLLESFEKENLFVISLDDVGSWYRFHPLFVDLLSFHLKKNHPEEVQLLHSRASQWFLEARDPGEAIHHALLGDQLGEAALILQENVEEIIELQGHRLFVEIIDTLSQEWLETYPRLLIHKAWFYLVHRGREEAKELLDLADGILSNVDHSQKEEYIGMLAAVKAYDYIYSHKVPEALESAAEARKYLPSSGIFWRTIVGIISGDAKLFSGNPKEAYPLYLEVYRDNKKYGNHYLVVSTGFKTATSLYYRGRLKAAEELTQSLLQMAKEEGLSRVPRVGLLCTLLGELLREKGDLLRARQSIERGLFISEPERPSFAWNKLFQVALSLSNNKYQEAFLLIEEIEDLHGEVGLPQFILSPALFLKIKVLLKLREVHKARRLLKKNGLLEGRKIKGGQEEGYLLLIRFMLLEDDWDSHRVHTILESINRDAISRENQGLLLKTLLIRAELEEISGNPKRAEDHLWSALQIGEESGYYQLFIDEGQDLSPLFSRMSSRESHDHLSKEGDMLRYVENLCQKISPRESLDESPKREERGPDHGLVEDLTSREMDVLHLLSKGLSNQEISKELVLSVGTVKWHTSNIYGKLGVRGRIEAVVMAKKYNLIKDS